MPSCSGSPRESARRRALGASLVAGALGALAGCTFLITFDDVPADDAGVVLPGRDDANAPDVSVVDAQVDVVDAGADGYALSSCSGMPNGQYCGNNRIKGYPYPDDLVTCDGGKVAYLRHCTTGSQCIHLPDPNPDQCDDCNGRLDTYFCGRQLSGWSATNAAVQVKCMNGAEVGIKVCTTCTNGATTLCP